MGNEAATMDNGLELTGDGFVLRRRPCAYLVVAMVGLAGALLTLFVVGAVFKAWLAASRRLYGLVS